MFARIFFLLSRDRENIIYRSVKGQSIIELVVALGIFIILVGSISGMALGSFVSLERGSEVNRASGLADEGAEATRAIKERAWNELVYSQSGLEIEEGEWRLKGEGTEDALGNYARVLQLTAIYRDESDNIISASAPEAVLDIMSKQARVSVSWDIPNGQTNEVKREFILTNWDASSWVQEDWSGGGLQSVWELTNKYLSDDGNLEISVAGELSLLETATSVYAISGSLISSAFNSESESNFDALDWEESLPSSCLGCDIKLQIKTAPDAEGMPGTWSLTWCGPEGEDGDASDYFSAPRAALIHGDHNTDQWIQYKIIITGDSLLTPTVSNISVFYR